jgi:HEAT repeat protein
MEEGKKKEERGEGEKAKSQTPVVTRSMLESCEACSPEPEIPAVLPDPSWTAERLAAAVKDKNLLVRSNAVMLLSKRSPSEALDPLIEALKDEEYLVKSNAMVALASFGREILERMVSALSDPEPDVRAGAAWVLGELKDPRSLEPLEKAAEDEAPLVRIQAKASLMAMGRGPKKEEK